MWSLGVLVGVPVAALLALVCLVVLVGAVVYKEAAAAVAGGIALAVVLAVCAFAYFPYAKPYHYWTDVSGVVAAVNQRVLTRDSSVEQRYVVRFTHSSQPYACDDTRCALVKKGDQLRLSCKRHWQYAGRDGWDCNYNQ